MKSRCCKSRRPPMIRAAASSSSVPEEQAAVGWVHSKEREGHVAAKHRQLRPIDSTPGKDHERCCVATDKEGRSLLSTRSLGRGTCHRRLQNTCCCQLATDDESAMQLRAECKAMRKQQCVAAGAMSRRQLQVSRKGRRAASASADHPAQMPLCCSSPRRAHHCWCRTLTARSCRGLQGGLQCGERP